MASFEGRTAVVTGAASGIGRALALGAGARGMRVVVADVDEAGLGTTAASLGAAGVDHRVVPTDVSSADAVEALAVACDEAFGTPDLVFNNAGVLVGGPAWERPVEDWEWTIGVNLFGVVHGVKSFVPRMLARGEPARIVNTASVGGLMAGPLLAPYLVTKHAVVGLSECLFHDLATTGQPVRVSVLCPGAVATGITDSERIRPGHLRAGTTEASPLAAAFDAGLKDAIAAGTTPEAVAEFAFAAIAEDRFWILPDPIFREAVEARARSILDGTDPVITTSLDAEGRAPGPPGHEPGFEPA